MTGEYNGLIGLSIAWVLMFGGGLFANRHERRGAKKGGHL